MTDDDIESRRRYLAHARTAILAYQEAVMAERRAVSAKTAARLTLSRVLDAQTLEQVLALAPTTPAVASNMVARFLEVDE